MAVYDGLFVPFVADDWLWLLAFLEFGFAPVVLVMEYIVLSVHRAGLLPVYVAFVGRALLPVSWRVWACSRVH